MAGMRTLDLRRLFSTSRQPGHHVVPTPAFVLTSTTITVMCIVAQESHIATLPYRNSLLCYPVAIVGRTQGMPKVRP